MHTPTIILAIETSCDETAAAVVKDGVIELASTVASSKDFHLVTGGIVPEVAARKQIEFLVPVLEQTIKKYYQTLGLVKPYVAPPQVEKYIDAVAVTTGPGLIGSLVVGVEAAKALALAWDKPLIPVNHLIGHIYGNFIDPAGSKQRFTDTIQFPAIVLVVSGGHTDLVLMRGHGVLKYLGGTLDDAAGEAFDKAARMLGLAKYLGGAELSKLASTCVKNQHAGKLPRPMLDQDNYDFSFSGLKTAVKRFIEHETVDKPSLACEFETAVVDVLEAKTRKALQKYNAKYLLLGGGVAANKQLRSRMQNLCEKLGIGFHVPPISMCTDNAVYIASAAYFNNKPKNLGEIEADPSLTIMSKA